MVHRINLLLFLLFTFTLSTFSQSLSVESNFKPALSLKATADNLVSAIQPDGKIIIASGYQSDFQVVNGQIRYNIVRLNTDGTTDLTFNCEICNFTVTDIRSQQDGKILIGGRSGWVDKLYRLNSDGSQDTSFNYSSLSNGNNGLGVNIKGIQADGKIFAIFTTNAPIGAYFFRLNTDGSVDNSFTPLFTNVHEGQYIDAKLLPDGRLFIFGNTSFGAIAQLNSDGSKNNAFESPGVFGKVWDIALQSDGKIAFIGAFSSVNGVNRNQIARLNADQSLDMSFNPTPTFAMSSSVPYRSQIYVLSNGKILVGDSRLENAQLVRLNNDGTTDNTFTPPTNFRFYGMNLDASERIYAVVNSSTTNFLRLNTNGNIDTSYAPTIDAGGRSFGLGLQPDGKILVAGHYRRTNGFVSTAVSRINPDGTTDTTFNSNEKFGNIQSTANFAVQPDGKILVMGAYFYNNVLKGMVRINADGSQDNSFNVDIAHNFYPRVLDAEVESDGKILMGGTFYTVNNVAKKGLVKLNSDGSVDTSYNVQLGGDGNINTIFKQSDGKYLIGGSFIGVNATNRTNIVRLNADGSVDTSFNASVGTGVIKIVPTPDGKYLVISPTVIYKLNADGSAVAGFQSPTIGGEPNMIYITSGEVLSDNSIVIGGNFVSVNNVPRINIARLNSDGSLNTTSLVNGSTDPAANTLAAVQALLKQPDGKVLVGGGIKYLDNVKRAGLARLVLNTVPASAPFDFDGDGRTDIVVYRPSTSVWYQLLGQSYQFSSVSFGAAEDILAPADYDGDGKTDMGIFRPSTGVFWYRSTANGNSFRAVQFGQSGDVPMPSDVDGDGKDDFVVYRPSNNGWYRLTATGQATSFGFGISGDKPVIGDFDGDGKSDYAVYRPSTGVWWYTHSSQNNATRAVQFGSSEDIPVAADYDGDGKTDFAVFRPSNGGWYIMNSGNGSVTILGFGLSGDKPIVGDYDGDGKADISVYRPSNGVWYQMRSSGGFNGIQLGNNTDLPIPNAFIKQ